MKDAWITLIKETPTKDDLNVCQVIETENEVMCRQESVTQNEFFGGGRNGLNPEMKFTVFNGDYEGERKCEYEGKRYAIYRTFESGDYTELYVQREGGTNGQTGNT